MNYYFLKLDEGNCEAYTLQGRNPTASVYFDAKGQAAYERGEGKSQPRAFWEAGKKENRQNTVMVVIHEGIVWLLQPAGPVVFCRKLWCSPDYRVREKLMPVRV